MNIDKINVGGNLYDVCDTNARAMISDEYNSATQYSAGDYCIWENTLKKANKSTTGTYDHTAWDDTNIVEVVDELNQNLSTLPTNIQSDNTINVLSVNLPYTFEKSGIIYMANNDSTGAILISGCWLGGFTANVFIPVTKGMIMDERTGNIATLNYIPNKES